MSASNPPRPAQTADPRGAKRSSASITDLEPDSHCEGSPGKKRCSSSLMDTNRYDREQARTKLLSFSPEALESLPDMPPEYYKFSDGLEWRMRESYNIPRRIKRNLTIAPRHVPATGMMSLPDEVFRMIFDELDWRDWFRLTMSNSRLYNVVTDGDYRRANARRWSAAEGEEVLDAIVSESEDGEFWTLLGEMQYWCFSCFRAHHDIMYILTRETAPLGQDAWKRQCIQCRLQACQSLENQAPTLIETNSLWGPKEWSLHPFCGSAVGKGWEDDPPRPCRKCRKIQLKANQTRAGWIIEHGFVNEAIKQAIQNRENEKPPPGERTGTVESVERREWIGTWLEEHRVWNLWEMRQPNVLSEEDEDEDEDEY